MSVAEFDFYDEVDDSLLGTLTSEQLKIMVFLGLLEVWKWKKEGRFTKSQLQKLQGTDRHPQNPAA